MKGSNQGISSSKLVRPGVQTGSGAQGRTAGYAAQIGTALGNRAMTGPAPRAQAPMATPTLKTGCALGNEVALNVGKGGPGTGRTVYGSGSQAQHGPATGQARPSVDPLAPWDGKR
jgi:hypothetical protein